MLDPALPPAPVSAAAAALAPTPAPGRRPGRVRWLRSPGLGLLLLVAVCAWGLLELLQAIGGPQAVRARLGLGAAAALVALHAVVAVSPFPSELIAPAHGAIYGFAIGWPLTWAGWWLGAGLEYALFRRVASDVNAPDRMQRLPGWMRRLPVGHPLFLILGRLLPYGNHAVNALAGIGRVPPWRFAWASALAFLPFSALVAALGSGVWLP